MAKHSARNHTWELDDRGGERTLPDSGACCLHCGQTFAQYSAVPRECHPRPVFAPKAETAPESLTSRPATSQKGFKEHNGHRWPAGDSGVVAAGALCINCGAQYGTPEAVWTCAKKAASSDPIDTARTERNKSRAEQFLDKKQQNDRMSDSEAWVHIIAARIFRADRLDGATIQHVCSDADALLAEYRKRFPQT